MKICYLGSTTTLFSVSYISELSKFHDIFVINISKVEHTESNGKVIIYNIEEKESNSFLFAKRVLKFFKLDRVIGIVKFIKKRERFHGSKKKDLLKEILSKEKPDIIFSFWGTVTFQYLVIIKKNFPKLKIIHIINTYPVREDVVYNETNFSFVKEDAKVFNICDLLVFTSSEMELFFRKNYLIKNTQKTLNFFDTFPSSFYPKRKLTKLSITNPEHHILFLGNTNFFNRTIDDVRNDIIYLANYGVHVHIQEPASGLKEHSNIHVFKAFGFQDIIKGKFAEFATQFDAIIVLYNSKKTDLRARISFPTRFALGLTTELPILIEKNKFYAIEEIFEKKNIIYMFKGLDEIPVILSNLKKNGIEEKWFKEFVLEKRIEKLINFIDNNK